MNEQDTRKYAIANRNTVFRNTTTVANSFDATIVYGSAIDSNRIEVTA